MNTGQDMDTPTRVADVISYLPKLTGTLSSDTGIVWKNPVFKTLLPKTKFRVGASVVTICAALNDSRLGNPSKEKTSTKVLY